MENINFLKNFKAGLQFSPKDDRNLMFGAYIKEDLPVLPSCDNLAKIYQKFPNQTLQSIFQMLGNDQFGDCTFAGLAHLVSTFKGLAGELYIPKEEDVIKYYFEQTNGQDSGCCELDVLKAWQKKKWFNDEDIAFVSIDPRNHDHIKQAIALFGGVYLGINLPVSAEDDFQANRTWDCGILSGGGHCVVSCKYDEKTINILTWGDQIDATWNFVDCAVMEVWAVISLEAEKISGFKLADLRRDLIKVGKTPVVEDINYITGHTQTII